jgi:hypothetical protein
LGKQSVKTMKSIFKIIKKSLKHKTDNSSVNVIHDRLLKLFRAHGVEPSQIPRVFPKLSLKDLINPDSLINQLTPKLIDEVATLFNVRSEWLEGVDDRIYNFSSFYNEPKEFFDFFSQKYDGSYSAPLRLLTSAEHLDYQNNSKQPVLLIFLEKIAELGEENIYRFHLDTEWDWSHPQCRLQLKAITHIVFKRYRKTVPIFKTNIENFELVSNLETFPCSFVNGGLCTDPSLEDYVLSPSYSVVAKETEELPLIDEYIEKYHLTDFLKHKEPLQTAEEKMSRHEDFKEAISEMNSKNAKAKYLLLDKHKEQFKAFYNDNHYTNKSLAARDYFTNLSIQERKVVVPTYYENDHDNGLIKAVRTLTNALRK